MRRKLWRGYPAPRKAKVTSEIEELRVDVFSADSVWLSTNQWAARVAEHLPWYPNARMWPALLYPSEISV